MPNELTKFVSDQRYAGLTPEQRADAFAKLEPRFAKLPSDDERTKFIGMMEQQHRLPVGSEETGLPGPALAQGAQMREVDVPTPTRAIADVTLGGVGRGVGAIVEGTGGVARFAGAEKAGKAITEAGQYLSEPPAWIREIGERPDALYDPLYIANLATTGAGSSLAAFVPGAGAMRLTGALAKLPLGAWSAVAKWAAGTTTGAVFESMVDAGSMFNRAVDVHKASPEAAAKVFTETLKYQIPVTMLTNAVGEFAPRLKGSVWKKALEVAKDATLEGGEEVLQGVAQRSAGNKVLGTDTPLLEGAGEEFIGGALGGALMSAGRSVASRLGNGGGQPVSSEPDIDIDGDRKPNAPGLGAAPDSPGGRQQQAEAAAAPIRAQQEIQGDIDAAETELEKQGVDVIKLYDPAERKPEDLPEGWSPMPEPLAQLYRELDSAQAAEDQGLDAGLSERLEMAISDPAARSSFVSAVTESGKPPALRRAHQKMGWKDIGRIANEAVRFASRELGEPDSFADIDAILGGSADDPGVQLRLRANPDGHEYPSARVFRRAQQILDASLGGKAPTIPTPVGPEDSGTSPAVSQTPRSSGTEAPVPSEIPAGPAEDRTPASQDPQSSLGSVEESEAPLTDSTPEQASQPRRDFSSTQVDLPAGLANDVRAQAAAIAAEDLATDGRESEPHVTVKYGLHGDDAEQVRLLLADEPPVRIKLGATSLFENDDADVVKADVDSPDLRRLNAKIAAAVANSDTHPEYKPHVTLAYVKPGKGEKYAGNTALAGKEVTLDRIVFSDRNGKKTEIPLGGKKLDAAASPEPSKFQQKAATAKAKRAETKARLMAKSEAAVDLPAPPSPDPKLEPWQMGQDDWAAEHTSSNNKKKWEAKKKEHRAIVEQALEDGKPVPAPVLWNYPDLRKKFPPPGAAAGPEATRQRPLQAHEMSPREFIANKKTKDQMIAEGADGYLDRAVLQSIPVAKITGREPVPAMEGGYKPGRAIVQPIEVEYVPESDLYTLYSGNHRVVQAQVNGQSTIPAYVQGDSVHSRILSRRRVAEQDRPLQPSAKPPAASPEKPTLEATDAAAKPVRKARAKKPLAEVAAEVEPALPRAKQRPFAQAVQAHGRWEAKLLAAKAAGKSTALIEKMVDKHAKVLRDGLGENFHGPLTAAEILSDAPRVEEKPPDSAPTDSPASRATADARRKEEKRAVSRGNLTFRSRLDRTPMPEQTAENVTEVFRHVDSTVWRPKSGGSPVLYLNSQAGALFDAALTREGETPAARGGVTLAPVAVGHALDALQRMRQGAILDDSIDGDGEARISALIDRLSEVASDQEPVVVVAFRNDQRLGEAKQNRRHEGLHRQLAQMSGSVSLFGFLPDYGEFARANSDVLEKAFERLLEVGYSEDMVTLTDETFVHVAAGQWEKVGLTLEEASGVFTAYVNKLSERFGDRAAQVVKKSVSSMRRAHGQSNREADSEPRGREARAVKGEVSSERGVVDSAGPDRGTVSSLQGRRKGSADRSAKENRRPGLDVRDSASVRDNIHASPAAGSENDGGRDSGVVPGSDQEPGDGGDGRGGSARAVLAGRSSLRERPRKRARSGEAGFVAPDLLGIAAMARAAKAAARMAGDAYTATIKSMGARISEANPRLMEMLTHARDVGDVMAGSFLNRLLDAEMNKLTRDERFLLLDVLEGRAKRAPKRVVAAYRVIRDTTDGVAQIALSLGVNVRTSRGKNVFVPMDNYFPHVMRRAEDLTSGEVRRDVIENLTRRGFVDPEAFLDHYVTFAQGGKVNVRLLDYLVSTGQAANRAEALAKLRAHRNATKRHGSLEHAREIDLPFYDPNPARVLPYHLATAGERLAQIAEFGQEDQKIKEELLNIAQAGGNDAQVAAWVDRIFRGVQEGDTAEERFARFLRTVQMLKLGLSFIPNMTQAVINVTPASDFRALFAGYRALFSASGRRWAIESGAAIDPVLTEAHQSLSGGWFGRFAERYLKPFQMAEQHNRVVAAAAGAHFTARLHKIAQGNTRKARWAQRRLADLGVNWRQGLSREDLLMASKKFSDMTQFRTRPENLPAWASTTWGKVFFQFKTFSYQQAKFSWKQTVGELRRGAPLRAARNLALFAILGGSAGELVGLLRNLLTGREDEEVELLERFFRALGSAGAAGIMVDAAQAMSRGKELEWLAGPAADMGISAGRMGWSWVDPDKDAEKTTKRFIGRHGGPIAGTAIRAIDGN